jgi:3-oxoacyl-[acyl-carrier protein] reductase
VKSLAGEVALLTGAGKGIGRALATAVAMAGARVALVARTGADIESLAHEIAQKGGEALAVAADVSDPAAVRGVVDKVKASFGETTLLINNAGVSGTYGPIDVISTEAWWTAMAVNLLGPLLFMHEVLPAMRANRRGRIINVVSNAALVPIPNLTAYAVSKAALTRLTESVHLEIKNDGLAAFALAPGNIRTEMAKGTLASPDAKRWIPEGLTMIGDRTQQQSDADLKQCLGAVLAIAKGEMDQLAGRYVDINDDFPAFAV